MKLELNLIKQVLQNLKDYSFDGFHLDLKFLELELYLFDFQQIKAIDKYEFILNYKGYGEKEEIKQHLDEILRKLKKKNTAVEVYAITQAMCAFYLESIHKSIEKDTCAIDVIISYGGVATQKEVSRLVFGHLLQHDLIDDFLLRMYTEMYRTFARTEAFGNVYLLEFIKQPISFN